MLRPKRSHRFFLNRSLLATVAKLGQSGSNTKSAGEHHS